ncbi:MAG: hypothetical protein IT324_14475 [Anaerolineae bacterium]|nr:hypothetical protein [Anaerolineae bacterium]
MQKLDRHSDILHFVRAVVLVDVILVLIVALVCWLGGSRNWYDYGTGLWVAGALVIGMGFLGMAGSWGGNRDFTYLYGQSAGAQRIPERTQQAVKDVGQGYGCILLTTAAGVVAILVGLVVQMIAK